MTEEWLKMWCPHCEDISPCSAWRIEQVDEGSGIHPKSDAEPMHGSLRIRVCKVCGSEFTTVEVEKSLINELIELRSMVHSLSRLS